MSRAGQSETSPGEITRLLIAWKSGDAGALEQLVPIVYGELHRMAKRYLRNERPGHTLQPTAIVHEAYLRLLGRQDVAWKGRSHFFAVAAQSMRRVLVEYARQRAARKRGGQGERFLVETAVLVSPRAVDLIAVDDALARLSKLDPEQGRIVELRFFGGLTEDETAEALEISPSTVHRKWLLAKAFLHRELQLRPM